MLKVLQIIALVTSISLLQGCDNGTEQFSESASKQNQNSPLKQSVNSLTNPSQLFGHYTYGHEVNEFLACGEKEAYWVTASQDVLNYAQKKHSQYTSKPYEKVYVEIQAYYAAKATDGFAMDYKGQLRVVKILTIRKQSTADCK